MHKKIKQWKLAYSSRVFYNEVEEIQYIHRIVEKKQSLRLTANSTGSGDKMSCYGK